jgi:hypothetical protein
MAAMGGVGAYVVYRTDWHKQYPGPGQPGRLSWLTQHAWVVGVAAISLLCGVTGLWRLFGR